MRGKPNSRYFEAPEEYTGTSPSIFLAGSITGCPDWQRPLTNAILGTPSRVVVLNPRRENFPIGNPDAANAQIEWEHRHLRKADAILFWFSPETLGPIVLFELGAWLGSHKRLFVGVDPDYERATDVVVQSRLVRPELVIRDNLRELTNDVIRWAS